MHLAESPAGTWCALQARQRMCLLGSEHKLCSTSACIAIHRTIGCHSKAWAAEQNTHIKGAIALLKHLDPAAPCGLRPDEGFI